MGYICAYTNTYSPSNRIVSHLEPLTVAANMTQSSFCRLDEVLLIFGMLGRNFQALTDPLDFPVKLKLLSSLESRWNKSEQKIFIAATALNPFVKLAPFKKSLAVFTTAGLRELFEELYLKFFNKRPQA